MIGVYEAGRGEEARERVLRFGVDTAVPSTVSAAELVRVVVETVRLHAIDTELAGLFDGDGGDADSIGPPVGATPEPLSSSGTIVVVLGGDGVTEVAVGIADGMVTRKVTTVLVDLDTVEPSIAQRLGLALTPNVFTATEHLRLRTTLDGAFDLLPHGFAVIAGIPNPREWAALTDSEAADLVGELAGGFAMVVVKINRGLEDLSSFAGTAGRYDVGRRMVAMADRVVAVSGASPVAAARLVSVIGDVRGLTSVPVHVVVNQAPSSRFVHGELTAELGRSVSPDSLAFLPTDSRVRKASWQGEVVRHGAFVRRLRPLVETVTPRAPTAVGEVRGADVAAVEGAR